jgi:hypothetical protein
VSDEKQILDWMMQGSSRLPMMQGIETQSGESDTIVSLEKAKTKPNATNPHEVLDMKAKVKQRLAQKEIDRAKLRSRRRARSKKYDNDQRLSVPGQGVNPPKENIWDTDFKSLHVADASTSSTSQESDKPESVRSRRLRQLQEKRSEIAASAARMKAGALHASEQSTDSNKILTKAQRLAEHRRRKLEDERQARADRAAALADEKAALEVWSESLAAAGEEEVFVSTGADGESVHVWGDDDHPVVKSEKTAQPPSRAAREREKKLAADEAEWAKAKEEEARKQAEEEERQYLEELRAERQSRDGRPTF